jgi:4-nitrophenyl phosphatase
VAPAKDASSVPRGCNDRGVTVSDVDLVLCDLDGVVWLAHEPIPGAVEAIASLRSGGRRVLFVTNNSAAVVADQEAALDRIGIPAEGDVVTSAMAAAQLVDRGERVLVVGGPGVVEAVGRRGAEVVIDDGSTGPGHVDAVVVGLHREFDYGRLRVAATALHRGARLIGTNHDPTYPTPRGPEPGGGSILAAVATAGLVEPVLAGKPHRPMADLVVEVVGEAGRPFSPSRTLVVGDRPDSDGAFAATLGCRFALVRSGVTPAGAPLDAHVTVHHDLVDLASLARAVA